QRNLATTAAGAGVLDFAERAIAAQAIVAQALEAGIRVQRIVGLQPEGDVVEGDLGDIQVERWLAFIALDGVDVDLHLATVDILAQGKAIVQAQRGDVVTEADRGVAAAVEAAVLTQDGVIDVGVEEVHAGGQYCIRQPEETQTGAGVQVDTVALAVAEVARGGDGFVGIAGDVHLANDVV